MVKKQTDIVPLQSSEIGITSETFKTLEGYVALEVRDQDKLVAHFKSIAVRQQQMAKSYWENANELYAMRAIMKKDRMWEQFMTDLAPTVRGLSRSSIMRMIQQVEVWTTKSLNDAAIQRLQEINKPLNLKRIAYLPPLKKNATDVESKKYAEILVNPRLSAEFTNEIAAARPSAEQDHDDRMSEIIRDIRKAFDKLNGPKAKQRMINDICGVSLGILGVSNPQTITPTGIPEKWQIKLGRPRLSKQA